MKTDRTIIVEGPGRIAVREETRAPVPAGGFRVTTVFSGISAGTELSYVKGTNPFLSERWDPGLGLFVPGEPNAGYPVTRLGYMEVSTVAESRTPVIGVGGTVAMTYGHRTGYTGDPISDRVVPLPEDLDPLLGIYVAHMGPICANGLLHAAADLCGPDVRSLGDGVRGRRVVVELRAEPQLGCSSLVEGQIDHGRLRAGHPQRQVQGCGLAAALEHYVRPPIARGVPPSGLQAGGRVVWSPRVE